MAPNASFLVQQDKALSLQTKVLRESGSSWCWAFTRWTRCSSGPWWLCCFFTHFCKLGFPRPGARADLALFHSVPHSFYELRGKPGFDFTLYPHPSPHTSPTEGGSEPGACSLCPITDPQSQWASSGALAERPWFLCCACLGRMRPLECHDYVTTVFCLFPLTPQSLEDVTQTGLVGAGPCSRHVASQCDESTFDGGRCDGRRRIRGC